MCYKRLITTIAVFFLPIKYIAYNECTINDEPGSYAKAHRPAVTKRCGELEAQQDIRFGIHETPTRFSNLLEADLSIYLICIVIVIAEVIGVVSNAITFATVVAQVAESIAVSCKLQQGTSML